MIDTTTRKPLRVSTDGTAGPYIVVPFVQLAELVELLDEHRIRHWVGENVVSVGGKPETAIVNLGRGADAAAVQAVLNDAC